MPLCFWAALEFSDSLRCTEDRAHWSNRRRMPREWTARNGDRQIECVQPIITGLNTLFIP